MPIIQLRIHYDPDWEEYQVQWIEDGQLNPDRTYHTPDEEDARLTLQAMSEELRQKSQP